MKGLNEFLLSRMDGMNKEKFNAECGPDLLMTALGYNCTRQVGDTKSYRISNSAKSYAFTVNTVNKTWHSKDNKQGSTTDLLHYMDYLHLAPTDSCTAETSLLNSLYKEMLRFDYRIIGSDNSIDITRIARTNQTVCNKESVAILARHGISMKAAELAGLKELVLSSSQGSKTRYWLALPTDNGGMTVFDGREIRPLLSAGITTIPSKTAALFYNVFENMMDYLSYLELESRRNWQMAGITTSIILNKEENIEEAARFLKRNRDMEPIRCYFANDDLGNDLRKYLAKRVGCRITHDMSEKFAPYRSISEAVRTKIPTTVMQQLDRWKNIAS